MENCSNCRFSGNRSIVTMDGVRSEVGGALVCRLQPPVHIVEYSFNEPQSEWAYPPVHGEDWCGQYQPEG